MDVGRLCRRAAVRRPDRAGAHLPDEGSTWNYTTWLNIAFLALAAALVVRFVRTGGMPMLAMMGGRLDADGPDDDGQDLRAHLHHHQ